MKLMAAPGSFANFSAVKNTVAFLVARLLLYWADSQELSRSSKKYFVIAYILALKPVLNFSSYQLHC